MSNLFKKASIITTPTAYEDGKLNSVKPQRTFGSELVTNGDFATDSDWTKGAAWTINSGTANYNDSSTSPLYQNITLNTNTYQLKFTISNSSGSGASIWIGNSSGSVSYTDNTYQYYTNGNHTLTINVPSNQSTLTFYGNVQGSSFSIDNVSVKEVIDADFHFTRGSSATRINEKGLVQDVQLLSGELVQNGDFEQIGSELVTNGSFDDASGWSFYNADADTNTRFENNSAILEVINSQFTRFISTTSPMTIDKFYKVTYEVTETDDTDLIIQYPSTSLNSSLGTHTVYIKATNVNIGFAKSGVGKITIDNVSVKEVGQNWLFQNGWNMGDGVAIYSGTASAYRTIYQEDVLTVSSKYRLTFDIVSIASGSIENISQSSPTSYNTVGTKTEDFIATNTDLFLKPTTDADLTIDNISVKEITDDTDLPRINYTNFDYEDVLGDELVTNGDFSDGENNWSFSAQCEVVNQQARILSSDGSFQLIQQSNILNIGKTYVLTFDLINSNNGYLKIGTTGGGSDIGNFVSAVQTHTFYFTAVGDDLSFSRGGVTDITIDNVSVKEITYDVVVPYSGEGSLLLEPQSTNLVTNSNLFTSWSKEATVTLTADYGISPDGTQNSTRMQMDANDSIYISTTSGKTASVYVKGTKGETIRLSNGSALTHTLSGKWDRIQVYDSSSISSLISINTYSGATARDIEIFGAQAEALSYATSYIPTNGSQVTRLADVCNNSGNSDLFNDAEGVLYAEISALADDLTFRFISISDGTTANRVFIGYQNTSNNFYVLAGTAVAFISHTITDITKIAVKYKSGDTSIFINGIEVAVKTDTYTLNGLNSLQFNSGGGGSKFYGNVKCLAVFKEALSDLELACLTS